MRPRPGSPCLKTCQGVLVKQPQLISVGFAQAELDTECVNINHSNKTNDSGRKERERGRERASEQASERASEREREREREREGRESEELEKRERKGGGGGGGREKEEREGREGNGDCLIDVFNGRQEI